MFHALFGQGWSVLFLKYPCDKRGYKLRPPIALQKKCGEKENIADKIPTKIIFLIKVFGVFKK